MDKIRGSRNFSPAGSANLKTLSIKDHACKALLVSVPTDMHARAMLLLKREQSTNVCDYSPIARSLFGMDQEAEAKIKRKFEVAYVNC